MPLEILNQKYAKVFLREIIDVFSKRESFFTMKNHKIGVISKTVKYFLFNHHRNYISLVFSPI